jgi:hypothetical protein
MTADGKRVVVVSGSIDLANRRDSITIGPAPGVKAYPPFRVRFVDGWTYIEIDAAVERPPTLRADARWIAFRKSTGLLPVPDRALPPAEPIDAINLPLSQQMVNAQFIDPPGSSPRRVTVRFARGEYSALSFTYAIDASGRIVGETSRNVARGGASGHALTFIYGPLDGTIGAPSTGVQILAPNENLYPSPTTANDA